MRMPLVALHALSAWLLMVGGVFLCCVCAERSRSLTLRSVMPEKTAETPAAVRSTPLKNGGDHSFGGRFGPLWNRPPVFRCHFLDSWRQDGENSEKMAKRFRKTAKACCAESIY